MANRSPEAPFNPLDGENLARNIVGEGLRRVIEHPRHQPGANSAHWACAQSPRPKKTPKSDLDFVIPPWAAKPKP